MAEYLQMIAFCYLKLQLSSKKMQKLINSLQQQPSWKQSLRKSCKINSLKTSFASLLTPLKIKPLYDRLTKTYEANQIRAKTTWFENQLKAFHWILIAVSWIYGRPISQFAMSRQGQESNQWKIIHQIFNRKQQYVLEYQSMRLTGKKQINKGWQNYQDQLLKQAINQKSEANKWNEIARILFKISNCKYYRTGKQCRQRWYNHLDPNKKHGNWSVNEDRFIAKFIESYGKKWSEIARKMGSARTQHMVKNRYKSIIIQLKKNYPQLRDEQQLLKKYNEEQTCEQPILQKYQSPQDFQKQIKDENCDINQHARNSYKIEDHTAYKLQNYFKNVQQNNFSRFSPSVNSFGDGQLKMMSPFCMTYAPQNLTPPLYATPPPSIPFFMNSFSQKSLLWANIFHDIQKKANDTPLDS